MIADRKKGVTIRGGENISAAEVEELLLKVLPEALEVAVVAVPSSGPLFRGNVKSTSTLW